MTERWHLNNLGRWMRMRKFRRVAHSVLYTEQMGKCSYTQHRHSCWDSLRAYRITPGYSARSLYGRKPKSQALPDSLNSRFGQRLSSMIKNDAIQFRSQRIDCFYVIVKNGRRIIQCFRLHKKYDAGAVEIF